MPQSGQKLIYRFFQTLQVQAIGGHTLNPQLWIHQLRGARTHTDTQFHPPTSNTASFSTWGIRHTSESPFYMGEKIFKASRTEVIPSHSVALAHPAWIKGFLFLVLLRAEVAAGFGKPVVPINVGNTSTNMGNSPSPALRAAQEAGEPFQQFLPSPEDGPHQQQPPTHPSPLLWSAKPLWDSSAGFIRHLYRISTPFLAY